MKTDRAVRDFMASRVLLRPATLRWYRRVLGRFAKVCPELPQDPLGVALFLNSLQGLADETAHGYWRALRALYRDVELRTGAPNPLLRMRPPKRRRKVQRTFQAREIYAVLSRPLSLRNRAILALLLDSGVRAGELVGLTWPDVSDGFIRVDGKTGERLVPLSPMVQSLLRLLRDGTGDGPLWRGKRGRLGYQGVYKAVRQACTAAGLTGPRLSPHTLRHTNGTLMVAAGCDLDTVQKLLGHSSIRQTEEYVHQNMAPLVQKHNLYSPLRTVLGTAQGQLFEERVPQEAEEIAARSSP